MSCRIISFIGTAALALLFVSCGGGSGSHGAAALDQPQSSLQIPALPALDELEESTPSLSRNTSATVFNLLSGQPVDSNTGTEPAPFPAPAEIALDPASAGGMAWAIYGLAGFPLDGSVLPFLINSSSDAPVWIALADFDRNRWDFSSGEQEGPNSAALSDAERLISPTGVMYVAVVTSANSVNVTNLSVLTNDDVPGDPVIVLNVLSDPLLEDEPIQFSASGSMAGNSPIYSLEYDFGDFAANDKLTTADPEEIVQWSYAFGDSYTVTLTARTEDGRTVVATQNIVVEPKLREVLVVFNENIQDDVDLADYYAAHDTGRFIDNDYMLGLDLADSGSFTDAISREEFANTILTPIREFLDHPSNSVIKSRVKYILLMKGIPHKINGGDEFASSSTFSSVDSELCTLYSFGEIPAAGWVVNGPSAVVNDLFQFEEGFHDSRQFYLASDVEFDRDGFDVTDGVTVWPLDYLVGRITGYTYSDARAIIDRSLAADTSGTGWTVFDSSDQNFGSGDPQPKQQDFDTMVDPVWPYAGEIDSGFDLLAAVPFNVFGDVTQTRIVSTSVELPLEFTNSVIGYAGWGVNHAGGSYPNGPDYITLDLGWNYLPGACFMSYESFNGSDFESADGFQRRGQGQVADFLAAGGTVCIGNAWEPFTIGVGDERWVFDRYIARGDRWIEAAYKGIRLLSWQNVVIGDPYCRVVADE